jgi:hypothetical protein
MEHQLIPIAINPAFQKASTRAPVRLEYKWLSTLGTTTNQHD